MKEAEQNNQISLSQRPVQPIQFWNFRRVNFDMVQYLGDAEFLRSPVVQVLVHDHLNIRAFWTRP